MEQSFYFLIRGRRIFFKKEGRVAATRLQFAVLYTAERGT